VTSRDVRFTFDVLTDTSAPPPVGGLARVVDSVTTPDAMTAVVWARRRAPDLFHQLTYATHILPAHLLGSVPHAGLASHRLTRGPVGNGPFRFRAWVPGQQIAFDPAEPPDARSRGPARVLVRVFPDYQAARRALARGDVDVMDYVRPPDIAALSARGDIRILRLPAYTYVVLQFNLRRPAGNRAGGSGTDGPSRGRGATAVSSGHPVFTNVQVRRALAMAIDRRAIVRNLLGDAGAVSAGPFTRAQWTADTSVQAPPFDPAQAERLLDAAGWIRPAAGATRERHGVPLEFSILVPASSATRVTAAVLIQAMLTKIGVRVTVDQREATAALTALERGEFDASLTGYRVDPDPAGVRDAWGGEAARSRQALNYSGYSSAATDDALARAVRETDVTAARAQYRAAYQQILDDAPAVFLYEPTAIVAHAARWHPVGARPDAWWAALRTWTRDPTLDGAP
jgi:peptide/nickel transport system substrate-binding protein